MTDDDAVVAAAVRPAGSLDPAHRRPAATAGLTCWWACVVTAAPAVVAVGTAAVVGPADAWIMVIVWMGVALLTWVVGWPAGWLAETLLDRAAAPTGLRVAAFAVLGAAVAVPLTLSSPIAVGNPLAPAVFAVVGALGAGGGRWTVAARVRRRRAAGLTRA